MIPAARPNAAIAIDVHDLTVAYHRKPVLWDVDVQVPVGKLIAIVGPNGAGKSTLLKAMLGQPQRERALAALKQVGMSDFAQRQIGQLSGGQQQRVFLARALAQDAALYLMDEPFAGVDAATERAILDVLRTMRDAGKTVIAVHHDLQTVPQYFDHVIMLNMRLVAAGPTNDVFTQENLQKTYGGRLNLLEQAAEAVRRAGT